MHDNLVHVYGIYVKLKFIRQVGVLICHKQFHYTFRFSVKNHIFQMLFHYLYKFNNFIEMQMFAILVIVINLTIKVQSRLNNKINPNFLNNNFSFIEELGRWNIVGTENKWKCFLKANKFTGVSKDKM